MSSLFTLLTTTVDFMDDVDRGRYADHSDSCLSTILSSYLNLILVHLHSNLNYEEKQLYDRIISYINSNKLFWRMRNKPLGYDGDYITINMLYDKTYRHESRLLNLLSLYVYNASITKQHAFKLHESSILTANTCISGPCNILYLSCGLCHDLRNINLQHANLTLVDINSDCISETKKLFAHYNVDYVIYNPVKYVFDNNNTKTYDLILTGGLLDYVPDRLLNSFISKCWNMLNPRGTLFITNIDKDPFVSVFLNHYCGWRLIQRDSTTITDPFKQFNNVQLDLSKDFTNLTWILKAHKVLKSKL